VGLLEDLTDTLAGIKATPEPPIWWGEDGRPKGFVYPVEAVQQVLALRSLYNANDPREFIEIVYEAASPVQYKAISRALGRRTLGRAEPVFAAVLIEAGLVEELIRHLNLRSRTVGDMVILAIDHLISTKFHLFPRHLLIFLQQFGQELSKPPEEGNDFRSEIVSPMAARLLTTSAAKARQKAVSLRLTMPEAPEIAGHGDQALATLGRLGAPSSLSETIRLATATLARPATSSELAGAMDRCRAYLEQVLRQLRKLLERANPDWPVQDTEGMTASALLNAIHPLLETRERELVQKYFNFISVEGSHATAADLEQARMARNLSIEFSWYLLERLKRRYPNLL